MLQDSVTPDLLTANCVILDLRGRDKHSVLRELVELLAQAGRLDDDHSFLDSILAREATCSTGLEQGVAIPHACSNAVRRPSIALGISRDGINFDAADGAASHIFLMIAEPADSDAAHLEILARASSRLIDPGFRDQLLTATSAEQVVGLFAGAFAGVANDTGEAERNPIVVAAVTSCPVGVSHTYLAAERLREAARDKGIRLLVETHGSDGVRDRLTADDIASATAVILAVDRKVDTRRFAGKPILETWVTDAIRHPGELLARAADGLVNEPSPDFTSPVRAALLRNLGDIYRHVMYGFSTILPFVIAGGILLSIGTMLDADGALAGLAGWLERLGGDGAMALLAPVLAGFIGRAIAGRIGLMPAAVGGLLMALGGAGLPGGIVAGLVGGYGMRLAVRGFAAIPAPLESIKAVLIYPLFGLLVCGGVSLALVGPLAGWHASVASALNGLDGFGLMLLGALFGGMMAIDLGGPINKIAYSLGIIAIGMEYYPLMAALMAAGMVPPIGIALASWFTSTDRDRRQRALHCLFKGACFVTEGVIPMMQGNSSRIVGAGVTGAVLAGAMSMVFGCELRVPHGGLFVTPLVGNWPMFLLSIACGVSVTALFAWWLGPGDGVKAAG